MDTGEQHNSVCPSCQGNFICGIKAGDKTCPCFNLPNVMPLEPDNDTEQTCLCLTCLEKRINSMTHQSTES